MPTQFKTQLVHLLRKSPYSEKSPGYLTLVEGLQREPLLAYVPNPLPPQTSDAQTWEPSEEVKQKLGETKTILEELEAVSRSFILPPSMLLAPLIIEDIKLLNNPDEQLGRARYLADYLLQLNEAIEQAQQEKFSIDTLAQWHQGIFAGPNLGYKGLLRSECLVFLRKNDQKISYYFTPPHEPMMKCLRDLEVFMNEESSNEESSNEESSFDPLIKLGLFFYQFMAIHPFGDGNGRMTRFYATVFLVIQHYLSRPFFFIGPYLNLHRDEYIRLLDGVRIDGDWDSWLIFFLDGICVTANKLQTRMTEINALYQRCFQLLQENERVPQESIPKILKALFTAPMTSLSQWTAHIDEPEGLWDIIIPMLSKASILDTAENKTLNSNGENSIEELWVFTQLIDVINAPLFLDDDFE
ncbi:MAG: Fic family protein [Cyanobacteria bacterium]|nr:Fic family protein [Cyanobacteriota bacterium]